MRRRFARSYTRFVISFSRQCGGGVTGRGVDWSPNADVRLASTAATAVSRADTRDVDDGDVASASAVSAL